MGLETAGILRKSTMDIDLFPSWAGAFRIVARNNRWDRFLMMSYIIVF
jgi:hypothetical protein